MRRGRLRPTTQRRTRWATGLEGTRSTRTARPAYLYGQTCSSEGFPWQSHQGFSADSITYGHTRHWAPLRPSVVPCVSLPQLVTYAHWHPPAALAAAHSRSRLQGRFVNELDKRRARLDLKRQQLVESRLLTTKKDTPVGRRRPVSAQDPTSEWTGSTPLEPWVLSADEEKRGASNLLPELAPVPYSAKWDA
jgi:hypothetical protein